MGRTVVMGAGRSGLWRRRAISRRWRPRWSCRTSARDAWPGPVIANLAGHRYSRRVGRSSPGSAGGLRGAHHQPWGIPSTATFVQEALDRGIAVIGEVELAHRVLRERKDGSRVLAVTGTNGKSTTTDFTAHLLEPRVFLPSPAATWGCP